MITIETIVSSLPLLLTAIASLRAASRLDARFANGGAIGLMDGPPILGPFDCRVENRTIEDALSKVSPLWEQSEGFKRAVILGLLFDKDSEDERITSIFTDITRQGDETAIAAAVDAGLLVPTRGGSTKTKKRGYQQKRETPGNNPLIELSTWFIRELSAPFSAIPAWHGMLCSFLREQKKIRRPKWSVNNIWRRWRGTYYDSSTRDFDALISGVANIPCLRLIANRNATLTSKFVKVKAYAPNTFRDLRNRCFRVNERQYAQSVLNMMDGAGACSELNLPTVAEDEVSDVDTSAIPQLARQFLGQKSKRMHTLPYISFQSNSKGAARAGTFFFFTADGAYMIKTVKKEEAIAFLEMLPEYHRFMSDRCNARNSLLTRFFGMYSVQLLEDDVDATKWNGGLYSHDNEEQKQSDCEERVFLIMNSVFPAKASSFVTERFDLKGSTVGRECSVEEQKAKGANAVLKDLNLKREVDADRINQQSMCGIHIGKQTKSALMTQLRKDVDLLNRCGVLDYSLLVGTAEMERISDWHKSNKKSFIFPTTIHKVLTWMDSPFPYHGSILPKVDGGHLSCLMGTRRGKEVTYYMGIIDFLQPWTIKKRLERDLKGLAGYDTKAISCVAPADYAARFLDFIEAHVT